jgi:hypothetical protein
LMTLERVDSLPSQEPAAWWIHSGDHHLYYIYH